MAEQKICVCRNYADFPIEVTDTIIKLCLMSNYYLSHEHSAYLKTYIKYHEKHHDNQ